MYGRWGARWRTGISVQYIALKEDSVSSRCFARKTAGALGLVLAAVLVAGMALGAAPLQRAQADSGIVFVGTPGTGAPPATLGPYAVAPFAPDSRSIEGYPDVTSVPGPTGDLLFDRGMSHRHINDGWSSSWSHGYTGDVYFSNYQSQVVMTLPANTSAFYFYVQGNSYGWAEITATAQDGTTSGPLQVLTTEEGDGARYFGFYTTGAPLTAITVDVPEAGGFAIGEFGISGEGIAPPPSSCTRADVAVVIYGGWDGIPIRAYVGGTEQTALYTARDAFGNAAVLWTFYPPQSGWSVSVAPQLPAGLDPARWQYKLVALRSSWPKSTVYGPSSASAYLYPCSERVFYFQLIDAGAK